MIGPDGRVNASPPAKLSKPLIKKLENHSLISVSSPVDLPSAFDISHAIGCMAASSALENPLAAAVVGGRLVVSNNFEFEGREGGSPGDGPVKRGLSCLERVKGLLASFFCGEGRLTVSSCSGPLDSSSKPLMPTLCFMPDMMAGMGDRGVGPGFEVLSTTTPCVHSCAHYPTDHGPAEELLRRTHKIFADTRTFYALDISPVMFIHPPILVRLRRIWRGSLACRAQNINMQQQIFILIYTCTNIQHKSGICFHSDGGFNRYSGSSALKWAGCLGCLR